MPVAHSPTPLRSLRAPSDLSLFGATDQLIRRLHEFIMASKHPPSESQHDREVQPRRRTRAPTEVIVRLHTDLAANENHPLANVDSNARNSERQRLIAAILARLASGLSAQTHQTDTMTETTN
jgi:hypothetical protein